MNMFSFISNKKPLSIASLPFSISPSTSFLRLIANEVGQSTVEFTAWFTTQNRHATVRFEFIRCVSSRMLCNGGEAGIGIGIGTVKNSNWLAELNSHQRKNYPEHGNNFQTIEHFFFRGHDCSVEVLAEGFFWKEIES